MTRVPLAAFRLLAFAGAVMLVVTFTPLVYWWSTLLAGPWGDPRADVLIVLGAGSESDGLLARNSHVRSVYAARAWRQGNFRKVVICGRDAAPSMRDYLLYAGIPPGAIVLESRSTSTRENALYAAELLRDDPGGKVLLTSDFHMFRAFRVFGKAGMVVKPSPLPDGRKRYFTYSQRWGVLMDLIEESVKIVYYRARGWM